MAINYRVLEKLRKIKDSVDAIDFIWFETDAAEPEDKLILKEYRRQKLIEICLK